MEVDPAEGVEVFQQAPPVATGAMRLALPLERD